MSTDYVTSPLAEDLCFHRTVEFFEVSDLLCKVHWQAASRYQQRRYERYELTKEEYTLLVTEMEYAPDLGELMPWVAEVAFQVTGFSWNRVDLTNKWLSGRILKIVSFARMVLGAPASFGDVQWYLNYLDWRMRQEGTSLNNSWNRYQRGERGPLLAYLNERLAQASEQYVDTATAMGTTAECMLPFLPGPLPGEHFLNEPFVDSQFPALNSVLVYLEGEWGTT